MFNTAIAAYPVENSKFKLDRVFPSLYLLYDFSETNKIKFGAGRRINRQHMHSHTGGINPIPSPNIDSKFIDIGNPYLEPEDIKKAEQRLSDIRPGLLKSLEKEHITLFPKVYQRLSGLNMMPQTFRNRGKIIQTNSNK